MAEHTDRYYCGRSHITYKKKEETTQKVEKTEKVVAKPVEKVEETKKKGKK